MLIVATYQEISPFLRAIAIKKLSSNKNFLWRKGRLNLHICTSGVGMTNTAFEMGKLSQKKFDLAINAGIAGAFNKNLSIGQIVTVKKDIFSELGAEDGVKFISADKLNLLNPIIIPKKRATYNILKKLKPVTAISVNTVHGHTPSIKKVQTLYQPDIESMEGAAFFDACNKNKWQCIQLRSISNYVEKRNKDKWNIPLAIQTLNNFLTSFINDLPA